MKREYYLLNEQTLEFKFTIALNINERRAHLYKTCHNFSIILHYGIELY